MLKGEESIACLKVALVAPFQRQVFQFVVVFGFFNFLFPPGGPTAACEIKNAVYCRGVFLKLFLLTLGKLCLDFCSPVYGWRDVTEGWLINAHLGGQGEAPLHPWGMELGVLGGICHPSAP